MKNHFLLACCFVLTLGGPAAAQAKKTSAAKTPSDVAALVMEGRMTEAARAAIKIPGSSGTAVRNLLESFDIQVTARKLDEAQSTLDSADRFLDELQKLQKNPEVSREPIRGRRLRLEGIRLNDEKQFSQAEAKLRQALEISRQIKDPVLEAGIHNNMGYSLQYQERFDEALAEYDQARQMAEAQKDDLRAGSYNFNMGQVLLQLRRSEAALEAYRRSETQNRAAGQASIEARAIMMQGMALSRIQIVSPEALKYFENARVLFEKQGDNRNAGWCYYLMGDHIAYSFKFAEAARYGELAVPLLRKAGDSAALRTCYAFLGDMYGRVPDPLKSEQYKKLAKELAPKN
jgi:tetratricopeptide (TPR) repeat protein